MKTLGSFLKKKTITRGRTALDEKSVFYVFSLIIKEEYGKQGVENVTPVFYKDRKIFIKTSGSIWASEIWLNRGQIVAKINREIGSDEIQDLAMSN